MKFPVVFTAVDIDDRRQQILRALRDAATKLRTDKQPWTHPLGEAFRDAADAGGQDRVYRMEAAGYVDGTRNALVSLRNNFVLPQGLTMQPLLDAANQVFAVLECDDLEQLAAEEPGVQRILEYLEKQRTAGAWAE